MNVLFEFPFAFAALAAIPVLLAIYLLRNRFRQFYVSSLMLWGIQRRHKQGGLNLDRLQTPLLFLLELLVFLLLAMAAAGPLLRSKSDTRRVVIVLDDSFSMLAKTETNCRQTAVRELKRYLKSSKPFRATFIQAGTMPNVLARDVDNMAEVSSAMDRWECLSPAADMDKALVIAGKLAGQKARILVVSDHWPDGLKQDSPVEYWSFGRPLPNVGFLHAGRTRTDDRDRCMLTIGNFSSETKTVTLTIESLDGTAKLYEKQIDILTSEPFQMIFESAVQMDLAASITDDALDIDNRVILLSPEKKYVRVAVDIGDAQLSESITRGLDVIPAARKVTQVPHLLITDKPLPDIVNPLPWTLQIQSDPNAAAFVGPFVVDRNHPLTDGLDLQGVIWSAGKNSARSVPIVSAGNTPLLEDEQDIDGIHHLHLFLNHEISTLQRSPNWPIFFWNLIHWRQQALPGMHRANWRLGSQVDFSVSRNCSSVQIFYPDGQKNSYENPGRKVVIQADKPGVYQIATDSNRHSFAVNALSADESDLRTCRTKRGTNPNQAALFWWEYRPYDWIFLLIAIILLAMHGYVVVHQSKGGTV